MFNMHENQPVVVTQNFLIVKWKKNVVLQYLPFKNIKNNNKHHSMLYRIATMFYGFCFNAHLQIRHDKQTIVANILNSCTNIQVKSGQAFTVPEFESGDLICSFNCTGKNHNLLQAQ